MDAPALIEEIKMRGASIRCEGDRLKVAKDELLNENLRAEIRANKPALLVMLQHGDQFSVSSDPATEAVQSLAKWESRGARLWFGTTSKDGEEYRTLEYEFDSAIPSEWLRELEKEKFDLQIALKYRNSFLKTH